MGKYAKKKPKNRIKGALMVLTVLLVLLIGVALFLQSMEKPVDTQQGETLPTETAATAPSGEENRETEAEIPETEPPATEPPVTEPRYLDLGNGLRIEMIGGYAGIYMEDGSDEVVSDVMMILLSNHSEEDLQIARIYLEYSDFTAEFEVTNLPAGERVVILEKNRQGETAEEPLSVECKNVAFFPEAMHLAEDRIRINGMNGMLEVSNISETDIPGPVYIYYKNSSSDLLYGGITYRVTLQEGLKAGETRTIIAGHYTQNNSRLLMVSCAE